MTPIKEARHLVALWMRLFGFHGLAMPWAIYLHRDHMRDQRLIRHERAHIGQMRRDGVVRFFVKYLWWSVRYGYHANPYEAQARAAEK